MHPIRELPPNVDQLPSGMLRARVYVGGTRVPGLFELDEESNRRGAVSPALRLPIETWRAKMRGVVVHAREDYGDAPVPRPGRRRATDDTLDAYAPRYLRQIESRSSFKADRSHLRACQACVIQLGTQTVRVGTLRLDDLTPEVGRLMRTAWERAPSPQTVRRVRVSAYEREGVTMPGYERRKPVTSGTIAAPRTIRHRLRVLRELLTARNGEDAPNPIARVKLPRADDTIPVEIDEETFLEVSANLARAAQPQQRVRAPRDPEAWAVREQQRQRDALLTWVRYLVLITTAQRPCQLMRAEKDDVKVKTGIWIVRAAKGGPAHLLKLTKPMRRAWELFIAADAWGAYDTTTHANRLHAAGWPDGVRPYNARPSLVMEGLNARDLDLTDVQAICGHKSPVTTNRFYGRVAIGRQQQIAAKLETRLAGLFRPRRAK